MADPVGIDASVALCRNRGLVTAREQDILANASVAIVGVGGDGGLVAERLVRLGVGHLRLVDPGSFDVENLNRQYGCTSAALGQSKAQVVAAALRDIAPWATVDAVPVGLDAQNAASILDCFDLIIDEAEYSLPRVSSLIYAQGRRLGVPVISGVNVGFGANVFAFDPKGMSFEQYLGVGDLDAPGAIEAAARAWCPRIPSYVDFRLVQAVLHGEEEVPAVSHSVAAVAACVVQEAFNYLSGQRPLVWAPRYIEMDLLRRTTKIRRASRISFLLSALRAKYLPTRAG
jgi:molybdopterin/thiamine biosynthesis adenylyltransferase